MSKLRPRILLLEPNQHVARRAKEHLVAAGYDTSWSKNAQDAINLADQHAPDLVIMELLLTAHRVLIRVQILQRMACGTGDYLQPYHQSRAVCQR